MDILRKRHKYKNQSTAQQLTDAIGSGPQPPATSTERDRGLLSTGGDFSGNVEGNGLVMGYVWILNGLDFFCWQGEPVFRTLGTVGDMFFS